MNSNHDIVPTLRMMDGVYTGLAADEIERLRARVALLERRAETSLIPGAEPTHRCKVCGAYWRKWDVDGQMSWNLSSRGCGECCDNVAMGDQIEALTSPAKVGVQPAHEQNARFAIDGAISLGRQGVKQPDADHWLAKYWDIGRQLATKVGGADAVLPGECTNAEDLIAALDNGSAKAGGDEREVPPLPPLPKASGQMNKARPKGSGRNDLHWPFQPGYTADQMRDYARAALSAGGGEDKRDLYYVQDTRSFVGNCPMWWGKDFRGYVTRMDEAGKYTREEAERICKRETDKMWPCSMIDPLRRPTIDFQHLPPDDERIAAIAANQAKGDAS